MRKVIYILILLGLSTSCEKNDFELTENADEYFFLRNNGADMPVWVKGNTLSKTFILVLHGGPGSGSIVTFDAVKSFKILQKKYAVVYWDQRAAGLTQGHYDASTINADQMVEDLEKLIVLIKSKYGTDISLFLDGGSWGGYLGFAYLVKDNNQNNIKGWIDESGAHNISLTSNAGRRKLIEYCYSFVQRGINTSEWQKILNWCESIDTITTTDQFNKVNDYANDATDLIADSIADEDIDYWDIYKEYLFGSFSTSQATANQNETDDSPLSKNFIDLNLSPQLYKVTISTLLIGGKFDFIVPNEVLYDAYNSISSEHKEIIIFTKSGHSPSSSQAEEFAEVVINFIENYK
jgi:pimeloyl-ACP methyl ester carboxylesterase